MNALGPEMFICDETSLFAACVRSSWSSDKDSNSKGSINQWRAFGPLEKHPLGFVQEFFLKIYFI